MSEQITIYSKPVNKHNLEGRFYNIYLNKNTNLDLSALNNSQATIIKPSTTKTASDINDAILKTATITPNSQIISRKQQGVFLTNNDYAKWLELEHIQEEILESQRKDLNTFLIKYQAQDKKIASTSAELKKILQKIQPQESTERRGTRQ